VLDRAHFPRDKVCAGWITPAVVDALELDLTEYRQGRTLQPFTGFRAGLIHGATRLIEFNRTISFGIRRCEFDAFLLQRAKAWVLSDALSELRRDGVEWVVNGALRTAMLVGAGGHFCPVARRLGAGEAAGDAGGRAVVAQETEFVLRDPAAHPVHAHWPELFFWPDLLGYGWCVRKGGFLNAGAGRLGGAPLPAAVREFTAMLRDRGLAPDELPPAWKGHAYLLDCTARRPLYDDSVVLVGDAAGLALSPSGEGILAAVESGVIAAEVIMNAGRSYGRDRLAPYAARIAERFPARPPARPRSFPFPSRLIPLVARLLFGSHRLTRRLVIEDGMLHLRRPKFERSVPARLSVA
jgi:flavin-dependent dehydrogenase